jgi:hypothetical protein
MAIPWKREKKIILSERISFVEGSKESHADNNDNTSLLFSFQ